MITIEKYQENLVEIWDKFVDSANNGTIFHRQSFLNYHQDRAFDDSSLIIKNKNKLVALLPAAIVKKNILYSHPGASFGGLVIKHSLSFTILNQIIRALEQYCIDNKFQSLILINSPYIYYDYYSASMNYLLKWNGYQEKEQYISHAVQLSRAVNLKKMLSKRKQRYFNNNKQLKNITFSTTKDFEIFYQLLKLSKKKYQSKPTHSFDELNQLQTIFPSQIKLIISKYKEQIVGGSLLFFTNSCSCLVFYNVISSKYRDTQLSALQLFYCMQYANKKGARVLDFGVSHSPEQKNVLDPKFSLIEFKEQLGAQGVLRTVFQKKYDVK